MKVSYYEILEVEIGASQEEIKTSYRRLCKIHHPDVNNGLDEEFKKIDEAYKILSDEISRSFYDETGIGVVGGRKHLIKDAMDRLGILIGEWVDIKAASHTTGVKVLNLQSYLSQRLVDIAEKIESNKETLNRGIRDYTKVLDDIIFSGDDGEENIAEPIIRERIEAFEIKLRNQLTEEHMVKICFDLSELYDSKIATEYARVQQILISGFGGTTSTYTGRW